MSDFVELKFGDQVHRLPVITGTDGNKGIDIRDLHTKTGLTSYDPGFFNTAYAQSKISRRDALTGDLQYRGYDVAELVHYSTFVETSYLLIYGDLPTEKQLKEFSMKLSKHSLIHEDMINLFDGFPGRAHPLAVLSVMVSSLSSYYQDEYEEYLDRGIDQAARLLAKIRTISAFSYKKMIGQPFVYPLDRHPYCTNFLYMLFSIPSVKYQPSEEHDRILNQLWILYADHEQNVSNTTVQLIGSTQANIFASVSSAINALWGSREGGRQVAAVELIEDIIKSKLSVPEFLERLKKGDYQRHSTCFGHDAYKVKSKRSTIAQKLFLEFYKQKKLDPIAEIALQVDDYVSKDPFYLEKNLYPNLEFYSAILFHSLGIPKELFTAMQAIGKLPGWLAHWREQRIGVNASHKVRPRQIFTGETHRKYRQILER
ncbi:citrate synthase [Leptospira hartskeerlii]|uniref:Citrate synthase n=1 Tax=Leptospira hartskeerlii TaxID=2023177 RepID=A0A2M9XGA6_9LEPT|nr:citrate/2-methylcitrate synthase [Leptospira hartskeerlii]PJZ26716.1 citrate synthase [Leptospira hartskeerlii]PJZ34802.1 citrate synthase [Leptospira hartskeerlii]